MTHEDTDFAGWLQDAQRAQVKTISRGIWRFALQWLLLALVFGVLASAIAAVLFQQGSSAYFG